MKLITRTVDGEGEESVETRDLTAQHLVDAASYRRLEVVAARRPEPPPADPAGGLPVG